MSNPERQHAGWEAKFGLGGVLISLPVLQVNHPSREADACYKPVQLATAARCGLTVPDTLVTNEPGAVRRFADRLDGPAAVKMLGSNVIAEAGRLEVSYTHPLTDQDTMDLSGVGVIAHLFQEWIGDKTYEVRVTAVGGALFAASIRANTADARIDWRSDLAALTYAEVEIPSRVATGIRLYLSAMGLQYGAFDFAVTSDGSWVFSSAIPAASSAGSKPTHPCPSRKLLLISWSKPKP